jgi:hypothetical protein
MTLYEKIIKIYPSLTPDDFMNIKSIILQNDGDDKGDYIKYWNHPTLIKPSEEQLAEIE